MSVLLLLLKYWQYAALASLLAFGAFELHEHNVAEQAKGRADERARVADSSLKAITPQLAKAETLYVHDTIRLTRTLAQTSVLRDTLLLHLTDTVRVREFIAQTKVDSAACFEAAHSCADDKRLLNQKIVALQSKLDAQPATLGVRHWYSDRFTAGPYAGIDYHGKASAGLSAQLALFRVP